MVNNPNVRMVQPAHTKTKVSGKRTKITNGPLYDLAIAKALLRQHGLRVVNEKAGEDMLCHFDPILTEDELAVLILAFDARHYVESERCATSVGMEVDCDGYAICWNRSTCREWAHGRKIFVKFGFRAANPRCLVVSIHPSSW